MSTKDSNSFFSSTITTTDVAKAAIPAAVLISGVLVGGYVTSRVLREVNELTDKLEARKWAKRHNKNMERIRNKNTQQA